MTYNIKRLLCYSVIFIIPILVMAFYTNIALSADIEESADMTIYSDYIITGEMEDYSNSSIKVNDTTYRFCDKLIIFTPKNRRIPLKDLDAAEEVKLFENGNCVRKIKVLRFAE